MRDGPCAANYLDQRGSDDEKSPDVTPDFHGHTQTFTKPWHVILRGKQPPIATPCLDQTGGRFLASSHYRWCSIKALHYDLQESPSSCARVMRSTRSSSSNTRSLR